MRFSNIIIEEGCNKTNLDPLPHVAPTHMNYYLEWTQLQTPMQPYACVHVHKPSMAHNMLPPVKHFKNETKKLNYLFFLKKLFYFVTLVPCPPFGMRPIHP